VAEAIGRLNRDYPDLEAILVGRGGGSIEDLWAFNEEPVARAIVASRIPVISCVGHETDFTIADFVADLRAPTPSAAAELVTRAKIEMLSELRRSFSRLRALMDFRLQAAAQRLQSARSSRMLQRPLALVEEHMQDIDVLRERLLQSARNRLEHWEKDFRHLSQKLHLISPLATLGRGYAIARQMPQGRILRSPAGVKPQDKIEVQLHEGRIHAQVERTEF